MGVWPLWKTGFFDPSHPWIFGPSKGDMMFSSIQKTARWWLCEHIFFWMFTPKNWGNSDPIWRSHIFPLGWWKKIPAIENCIQEKFFFKNPPGFQGRFHCFLIDWISLFFQAGPIQILLHFIDFFAKKTIGTIKIWKKLSESGSILLRIFVGSKKVAPENSILPHLRTVGPSRGSTCDGSTAHLEGVLESPWERLVHKVKTWY